MAKILCVLVIEILTVVYFPFMVSAIESSNYILDSYSFGNFPDEELESSDYSILLNSNLFSGEIIDTINSTSGLVLISTGSDVPTSYAIPSSYTTSNNDLPDKSHGNPNNEENSDSKNSDETNSILKNIYFYIFILALGFAVFIFLFRKYKSKNFRK